MHICYITNEYPGAGNSHGGIGSFIQTIGRALTREGVEVSVIFLGKTNGSRDDAGVRIHEVKHSIWPAFRFADNYFRINHLIRRLHSQQPIDIIETPEAGLAFLRKIKGVSYVVRLHGGHHFFAEAERRKIRFWKGWQEKRSFSLADAFAGGSQYVARHTGSLLRMDGRTITTIPYPIDTDLFKPQDNIRPEKGKIVFAGTVCEKKGVRQLLAALPAVVAQYPDAHLDIYGRDWFFPDGSSYIAMIARTIPEHLKGRVHFKGAEEHRLMPLRYASADVCVFPSHMETQGLVAPEAMATGRPVVFSQTGPGPETIEHRKTGLLCDPYSPDSIAEQILYVFRHPAESAEMGLRARAWVQEKFGVEKVAAQNLAFYSKLAAK